MRDRRGAVEGCKHSGDRGLLVKYSAYWGDRPADGTGGGKEEVPAEDVVNEEDEKDRDCGAEAREECNRGEACTT